MHSSKGGEADGDEANEEGSFLNSVLCYTENELLMEVKAFLDSVEIETALLAFDGLMVYGDYYDHSGLLMVLHNRLKHKFGSDMYFDYKQHETTALDDMPTDFDPTVVLGDEWNMLYENKKVVVGELVEDEPLHRHAVVVHDEHDRAARPRHRVLFLGAGRE